LQELNSKLGENHPQVQEVRPTSLNLKIKVDAEISELQAAWWSQHHQPAA
jgi:hypothetical protein